MGCNDGSCSRPTRYGAPEYISGDSSCGTTGSAGGCSPAEITQGNATRIVLTLNADCTPIEGLSQALTIQVQLLNGEQGVVFDETWAGAGSSSIITVDQPCAGQITLTLPSSATDIPPGVYCIAVQVEFGADDNIEWSQDNAIKIIEDKIP